MYASYVPQGWFGTTVFISPRMITKDQSTHSTFALVFAFWYKDLTARRECIGLSQQSTVTAHGHLGAIWEAIGQISTSETHPEMYWDV